MDRELSRTMPGPTEGQSREIREALAYIFDDCQASPTEIARELGVTRQAIYQWRKGHEPVYRLGVRILLKGWIETMLADGED